MFNSVMGRLAPTGAVTQLFPPESNFKPSRDIKDVSDKIMLVTGFNSGLGFEPALQLIQQNVGKIYLAARSESKAKTAIAELKKQSPGSKTDMVFLQLDISDLNSVRKAANEFLSKESRLDVLFNNAGIAYNPVSQLTAQNYDIQFGTNVLGPFLFTEKIWPALEASRKHTGQPARIVNTSSFLHTQSVSTPSGIDMRTLEGGAERDTAVKKYGPGQLYGQSKLGNIFASDYWSTRDRPRVESCSLHPGVIITNIGAETATSMQARLVSWFGFPVELGALTQLFAGTAAENINGKYYIPWAREGAVSAQARDEATRTQVISWLQAKSKAF